MICPHCTIAIHDGLTHVTSEYLDKDSFVNRSIWAMKCPECGKYIFQLRERIKNSHNYLSQRFVYPRHISRGVVSKEVPDELKNDFLESSAVLTDSPKASAALSRRILQHVLREKAELKLFNTSTGKVENAKVKKGDLSSEIQQVLDNGGLPSQIADGLDAVRNIGNFAAHPIKSQSTGEIVPVELGEAEWNLDVIESLFDYYYVQPSKILEKRNSLDKKLADAGKPAVK